MGESCCESVCDCELWVSAGSGCERIVTRGTNEFQLGQVDVSVRAAHTAAEGAGMRIELPMWRVALAASMVGVERVEFVGSDRVDIVVDE